MTINQNLQISNISTFQATIQSWINSPQIQNLRSSLSHIYNITQQFFTTRLLNFQNSFLQFRNKTNQEILTYYIIPFSTMIHAFIRSNLRHIFYGYDAVSDFNMPLYTPGRLPGENIFSEILRKCTSVIAYSSWNIYKYFLAPMI